MLLEIFLYFGRFVSIFLMVFWKIFDVVFILNIRCLYFFRFMWVLNVVMWWFFGLSLSWWYLEERFSLLKMVVLFRFVIRLFMVGIRCFLCFIVLLVFCMFMYNLICLEFFGIIMMGFIYGVGFVIFLIMFKFFSFFNFFFIFCCIWKGIWWCGCCLGCILGFMWSLIIFFFILLMLLNRFLNFLFVRYWGLVLLVLIWLIICRSFSFCVVLYFRRFFELFLIMCRVVDVLLDFVVILVWIVFSRGRGVGDL